MPFQTDSSAITSNGYNRITIHQFVISQYVNNIAGKRIIFENYIYPPSGIYFIAAYQIKSYESTAVE
jgi:hypothetical protein